MSVTNGELIERARTVAKHKRIKHGFMVGELGCALVTVKGNIYRSTSIDTTSGMGFWAEHCAIATMLTHGEHKIRKILATLGNGKPQVPSGRCRELIH